MSSIYFFRGKAATGKTAITNILSNRINASILRKDNIFDVVSHYIADNSLNNSVTYDLLSKLIQTNIDNGADVIVDIGLSNTDGWKTFQSKIDFKNSTVFTFLCDCSDMAIWKKRFEERLKNPAPNQYFKTVEEVLSYYSKSKIELLHDEYYIDSAKSMESIINFVCKTINI